MQASLKRIDDWLLPIEDLFFRWLSRVVVAALLAASAWMDDAPPLELAAYLIAIYVAIRLLMQLPVFFHLMPFESKILKSLGAILGVSILVLSFLTVFTFVDVLSVVAMDSLSRI